MNHPRIIQIYGIWDPNEEIKKNNEKINSHESETNVSFRELFIVMEYLPLGNLSEFIKGYKNQISTQNLIEL